jgi:hypothetical protein
MGSAVRVSLGNARSDLDHGHSKQGHRGATAQLGPELAQVAGIGRIFSTLGLQIAGVLVVTWLLVERAKHRRERCHHLRLRRKRRSCLG